jgi:hypothetical protein
MSDAGQPDRHTYTPAEAAAEGEDDIVQNEQIVNTEDAESAAHGDDSTNEETA